MTVAVWRIAIDTPDYTADDLTGKGARQSGGRWNRLGTPMVYAASSISLACLETVVHLGTHDLPLNRYLVRVEVPDDVWSSTAQFDARNVGWDAIPAGKVSLDAGETWAARRSSALFVVPSVIIPEETNILINPRHKDASRIIARKIRRWTYDARLGRDA